MNVKYFWLVPILSLLIGGKAYLSRSANQELEKIKASQVQTSKVNLDEYWPFPKAISRANPSLFEIEQQLINPPVDS